jgi:hypothetical protein
MGDHKSGQTHQGATSTKQCETIKWDGVRCGFGIWGGGVQKKLHNVWVEQHEGTTSNGVLVRQVISVDFEWIH